MCCNLPRLTEFSSLLPDRLLRVLFYAFTVAFLFSSGSILAQTNPSRIQPGLQEYEIQGIAQYRLFSTKGKVLEQTPVDFICSVEGSKWFIRIHRTDNTGFDYQEVSFDGDQIYYLTSLQGLVQEAQHGPNADKVADNIATAYIYNGQNVFRNIMASEVGPIWLTYASGFYFQQVETNQIEPVLAIDASGFSYQPPCNILQMAQWKLSNEYPMLPTTVVYFDDGVWRGYSVSGSKFRPAPYNHGFTNAIYEVTKVTNVDGLIIPLASCIKLYAPQSGGMTNTDLRLGGEYDVQFLSMRTNISITNFKPTIPGNTFITDARIKVGSGYIGYHISNSWPTINAVTNDTNFKKYYTAFTSEAPASEKATPRYLILAFMVLFTISFICWIALQKVKHKHQNKGQI